ncbi:LacI family DNA-binding transcriptional regulator [Maritimibacter dapengensis]|uniref:LacI family DNA-binding transcriptional regulator n=1 Tax=Maritimibacter dapengensis TaxID=2836868 RepID=A0ABS6T4U8_9RHOB|nr:LacI family DNA-binding transcriptional regulator [Maritimibacter dapengensis]MBV7380254.1 LacI family DNA-binding transcriptional regulator [Maritimibacter dapengensis]
MLKQRVTIADLARESGVSISTVNRILAGAENVRGATIEHVQQVAEKIGFYGTGVLSARREDALPHFRFGFLLQQSTRDLYRLFGEKVREAASARRDERIDCLVDFVDRLEPSNIAGRLRALGKECDAVALIAADHPLIGQAIRELRDNGTSVVTYITDQSAPERAGFVGTDNWKLGRTAAFFITQMTQGRGRIAVFIGNHRYQCQDVADAAFRSYIREHAPDLIVNESEPTHEDSSHAYEMVRDLIAKHEDLRGILIVGGGISGVLRALREAPEDRRSQIKLVCRDIGPETRKGLTEGLITAALCHPMDQTSETLIQTMIDVATRDEPGPTLQKTIPFEIITQENI